MSDDFLMISSQWLKLFIYLAGELIIAAAASGDLNYIESEIFLSMILCRILFSCLLFFALI